MKYRSKDATSVRELTIYKDEYCTNSIGICELCEVEFFNDKARVSPIEVPRYRERQNMTIEIPVFGSRLNQLTLMQTIGRINYYGLTIGGKKFYIKTSYSI